jgi:hypothetical protein
MTTRSVVDGLVDGDLLELVHATTDATHRISDDEAK